MKCMNQLALACPIGNNRTSAGPMAALSDFYESHEPPSSGNACGTVLPHCDGHQNGQQRGHILHRRFVDCCHGNGWGDMERVVNQWQRPVASDLALDILHRAMPRALLQCLHMTIKMACDGGISLVTADILFDTTRSYDHVMVH